MSIFNMEI
jgi:hypothetical protein